MEYGVGDAGIAAVGKTIVKAPFVPIVAGSAVPLIVTETVSPLDGYTGPLAEMIPDRVTDAVPVEIVWDGASALNTGATGWTVIVVIVRNCWLLTVTVAALTYVPAAADAPLTCNAALLPDAKFPNEQFNT